eukprot:10132858-Lingulodinium_polyedra.AAC.1
MSARRVSRRGSAPPRADLRAVLIQQVPWANKAGYLIIQRPFRGQKGRERIAVLVFTEDAYPAQVV